MGLEGGSLKGWAKDKIGNTKIRHGREHWVLHFRSLGAKTLPPPPASPNEPLSIDSHRSRAEEKREDFMRSSEAWATAGPRAVEDPGVVPTCSHAEDVIVRHCRAGRQAGRQRGSCSVTCSCQRWATRTQIRWTDCYHPPTAVEWFAHLLHIWQVFGSSYRATLQSQNCRQRH
jgi:hypothetical protein